MHRDNKQSLTLIICSMLLVLSGCQLKRELPESSIGNFGEKNAKVSGKVLHVCGKMWEDTQIEAMLSCLWGTNKENAEPDLVKPYYENAAKYGIILSNDYYYERGCEKLHIARMEDLGIGWISYRDDEYGRAQCYGFYNIHGYLDEGLGFSMSKLFPDQELENCSREAAVSFCRPFAESCGYDGDSVKVFAMTKERLTEICDELHFEHHAPDPGYKQAMSDYETYALLGKLDEAEEKNDQKRQDEINALLLQMNKMADIPWTEEDEAYLLVYQPELNHLSLESYYQMLSVVYVPALNKIIIAEGYTPLVIETMEEVELITREEAVSTTVLSLGMEDNEYFDIVDIKLVYGVRAIEFGHGDPVLHPCWKVEYQHPVMDMKDSGTLLIDAVTGHISQFTEQG